MLLDDQLKLTADAGMALTASAASTYTIDLTTARNIGVGELFLVVVNIGAMTGSGATVTPSIRTSATRDSATPPALNGTVNTLANLPVFPALSATGTMRIIRLPIASKDNPWLQYFDVYFTVAGGTNATAKFRAFITDGVDANQFYTSNISVQ